MGLCSTRTSCEPSLCFCPFRIVSLISLYGQVEPSLAISTGTVFLDQLFLSTAFLPGVHHSPFLNPQVRSWDIGAVR